MAKCPAWQPGFGGFGFMNGADLPKWLVVNFSENVWSVALGNIDSSSRMDKIPMGCESNARRRRREKRRVSQIVDRTQTFFHPQEEVTIGFFLSHFTEITQISSLPARLVSIKSIRKLSFFTFFFLITLKARKLEQKHSNTAYLNEVRFTRWKMKGWVIFFFLETTKSKYWNHKL